MRIAAYTNTAASVLVLTGDGVCYGAVLTSGSDAATLTLYDNTTNSGTVLFKLSCAAANSTATFTPAVGLPVGTGIYAVVTGTAASATVVFAP